jgi:ABC-type glycerol-3-phosphate transport system permease component
MVGIESGLRIGRRARGLLAYLLYLLVILLAFIPILWIAVTSIKRTVDVFVYPPVLVPRVAAFDNYVKVFQLSEMTGTFFNSIVVAVTTTIAVILVTSLTAYGFSRFRFRGKGAIMLVLLGTQMIPPVTNIIPLYITMLRLNLLDSITALCLVYSALNIPFCVWILKSYFDSIPTSFDEAAMIDGANRLYVLFRILFPVSLPGIAAAGLYVFIQCWNEFYLALVLTSTLKSRTIPLGLFSFQASYDIQWNLLCAASMVAMLPVIVLFIVLQESFVSGLTKGAFKE